MSRIVDEAYREPDLVREAPARASVPRVDEHAADDPDRWAFTWRAWQRKRAERGR
jgi:glycine dehydrogenase subunit 2